MMDETKTKPCECGKKMIKRWSNMVLTVNPPIYTWYWWCGGCGREEKGGQVRGATEEEEARQGWERAQTDEPADPRQQHKTDPRRQQPGRKEQKPL